MNRSSRRLGILLLIEVHSAVRTAFGGVYLRTAGRTLRSAKEVVMAIVGIVALALVALGIVLGLYVALVSVPDLRRYLKIRHM